MKGNYGRGATCVCGRRLAQPPAQHNRCQVGAPAAIFSEGRESKRHPGALCSPQAGKTIREGSKDEGSSVKRQRGGAVACTAN